MGIPVPGQFRQLHVQQEKGGCGSGCGGGCAGCPIKALADKYNKTNPAATSGSEGLMQIGESRVSAAAANARVETGAAASARKPGSNEIILSTVAHTEPIAIQTNSQVQPMAPVTTQVPRQNEMAFKALQLNIQGAHTHALNLLTDTLTANQNVRTDSTLIQEAQKPSDEVTWRHESIPPAPADQKVDLFQNRTERTPAFETMYTALVMQTTPPKSASTWKTKNQNSARIPAIASPFAKEKAISQEDRAIGNELGGQKGIERKTDISPQARIASEICRETSTIAHVKADVQGNEIARTQRLINPRIIHTQQKKDQVVNKRPKPANQVREEHSTPLRVKKVKQPNVKVTPSRPRYRGKIAREEARQRSKTAVEKNTVVKAANTVQKERIVTHVPKVNVQNIHTVRAIQTEVKRSQEVIKKELEGVPHTIRKFVIGVAQKQEIMRIRKLSIDEVAQVLAILRKKKVLKAILILTPKKKQAGLFRLIYALMGKLLGRS